MKVIICMIVMSGLVFAHHGGQAYDRGKLTDFKATITEFRWSNPHVQIFFDTKDEKGNVRHWSGEMANPSQYIRGGWGKKRSDQALKPGTEITISYYLSRVEEHLPKDIGAALIVRIRDEKDERILLDRN